MDFDPLVPNATASHDVTHILSESFAETIKSSLQPTEISENLQKNNVDPGYSLLRSYAHEVKQFHEAEREEHVNLQTVELNIMKKQADDMSLEHNLDGNDLLKQSFLLKRDGFFTGYNFNIEDLNLINKKDILPSTVEQSLEFVHMKDVNKCKHKHYKDNRRKKEEQQRNFTRLEIQTCDVQVTNFEDKVEPLRLEPTEIVFEDFELNATYKKTFRLQNITHRRRPFFFKYPKYTPFSLKPLSNFQFLAPGMCIEFQVTYHTNIYHNHSMNIEFSTSGGYTTTLKVTSFRRPPHLRVYLFKSMEQLKDKCPGAVEFWEKRCTALNDTIDCGHCFIGDYNYLSLLIGNVGSRGSFFMVSEDEWVSGNINNTDCGMQFTKGCFKIFPSYITVEKDEVAEICVTFTPTSPGLQVEKLYFVADNNISKAVEMIGDGLYFSRNMIQPRMVSRQFEDIVKIGDVEFLDEELPQQRVFYMGYIENSSSNEVTFTLNNRSAMKYSCYWIFREDKKDSNAHFLELDWFHMKNSEVNVLLPYTLYDFEVDIKPEADKPGHYSIIAEFCIEKIPEKALKEGEEFVVRKEEEIDNIRFVDIQLFEVEIGCDVFIDAKEETQPSLSTGCDCPEPISQIQMDKVEFSTQMIDIGVIPVGVDIERKMKILKNTPEDVYWVIKEIIYDIDVRPSMIVARKSSLDKSYGILSGREQELKYRISAKKPIRWVSMLLLFTTKPASEDLEFNAVCILTYEVVEWDIRIHSDVSNFPIACSLKLHYVGIPYKTQLYIQNFTPLMGCFWLLPPVGEEAHKMDIECFPKFGVIRPGEKIKVVLIVVPREIGVVENVFVPCFVNRHRPPIMIRVMGVADDVNVCFYIPSQVEGYDKILWPSKVLNDVDFQEWESKQPLWEEEEEEFTYAEVPENSKCNVCGDLPTGCSCKTVVSEITVNDDSNESSDTYIESLAEFLKDRCKDDFLRQDYAVELRDVPLRTPRKFSFYIENVTPIEAHFQLETTNFFPYVDAETNVINAVSMIYPESTYSFWDKTCSKNGIVVVPDVEEGQVDCGDAVLINVWVYATTWGIYTEEIVVNINDVTPFYFNVFIEVKGPPIEFPIAKNTIRDNPTLRFGHIPYMTEVVTETLLMKNTCCVPLNIQLFLFDSSRKKDGKPFNLILDVRDKNFRTSADSWFLFLSDRNYGDQNVPFMNVFPRSINLEPDETSSIKIEMNPKCFPVDFKETNLKCHLIGYIFVKEEHKNRQNLFYRKSAEELKPLQVDLLATIALPLLKLNMICGTPECYVYATEVVDGKGGTKKIKLSFQNGNLTTVFVTFHVEAPFSISHIAMRDYDFVPEVNNGVVRPGDILDVEIECSFTSGSIENMANWLFGDVAPVREKVCSHTKMVSLCRHLNIHQRGVLEQSIPLLCEIYYPEIEVSPPFLKFEHVNIGRTKKLFLHIFNRTKADIAFSIDQSLHLPEFKVKPKAGVIQKTVGLNRSFIDIQVYFTPTLHNFYQEAIYIKTNIPQCYLEVPMNGFGIQNEKFEINNFKFQP